MDRGGVSGRDSIPFSQEKRDQKESTNQQKKPCAVSRSRYFSQKKNALGIIDILALYESVSQRVALATKDLRHKSNIKGGNWGGVRKWLSRFFDDRVNWTVFIWRFLV